MSGVLQLQPGTWTYGLKRLLSRRRYVLPHAYRRMVPRKGEASCVLESGDGLPPKNVSCLKTGPAGEGMEARLSVAIVGAQRPSLPKWSTQEAEMDAGRQLPGPPALWTSLGQCLAVEVLRPDLKLQDPCFEGGGSQKFGRQVL